MKLPTFGNDAGTYPFPLRVSPLKQTREMTVAELYRKGALEAGGSASNMYVRQYCFPHEYREDEQTAGHYTDRLRSQDPTHYSACYQKHIGCRKDLLHWFLDASDQKILAFLKDVLRADDSVLWTGFRITGQTDRSIGPPIFWLHLFAKDPSSDTKVYTGSQAPNVKQV